MSQWPDGAPQNGGEVNVQNEDGTQLAQPAYALKAGSGLTATFDEPSRVVTLTAAGGGGIVESVVAGTNVTVDDTDPANPIVSAAGGGGGSPFPLSPPETPSAFDDEFTSATLDPKWSVNGGLVLSGGSVDPDFDGTWLRASVPGNATATVSQYRIEQTLSGLAAGTAFTMVARVSMSTFDSLSNTGVYIVLAPGSFNDGSGNQRNMAIDVSTTNRRLQIASQFSEFVAPTIPLGVSSVYIGFRRTTGNVCYYYWSVDGIGWRFLYSETLAVEFTRAYIWFRGPNSGTTVNMMSADFIRFNDARFALPAPS